MVTITECRSRPAGLPGANGPGEEAWTKRHRGRIRRALGTVMAPAVLVGAISAAGVLAPTAASAVANFPNAAVADTMLRYVGRNGVDVCRDAGLSTAFPGQCKQTLNCVLSLASGGQVRTGGGYYSDYQRAGGIRVSMADATKGDVIQLNGGNVDTFYNGMHTAVVTGNVGGGTFDVVDSNFNNDGIVRQHRWNASDQARRYGLSVNIWRLGQVSSAPQTWSFRTNADSLRVREGAGTGYRQVGLLGAAGTVVQVDRQCSGTSINGNAIWDHIVSPSQGWVADYYVNTGVNGWYPGIPQRC